MSYMCLCLRHSVVQHHSMMGETSSTCMMHQHKATISEVQTIVSITNQGASQFWVLGFEHVKM